jgi:hypothetical protein
MTGDRGGEALATLTHARLRASQGDHRGARKLLVAYLDRNPDDAAARRLLRELEPSGGAPAADAAARVARLRAWLERLRRNRA